MVKRYDALLIVTSQSPVCDIKDCPTKIDQVISLGYLRK